MPANKSPFSGFPKRPLETTNECRQCAAGISIVGHVLFYQNHVLEVKINKLLDQHGLFVADKNL
jgi:hypothetical protein